MRAIICVIVVASRIAVVIGTAMIGWMLYLRLDALPWYLNVLIEIDPDAGT